MSLAFKPVVHSAVAVMSVKVKSLFTKKKLLISPNSLVGQSVHTGSACVVVPICYFCDLLQGEVALHLLSICFHIVQTVA